MPAHDKDSLPDGYLEDNVAMALEARHSTSWAAAVPLDIFNNYVLPYASLSVRHHPASAAFLIPVRFPPLIRWARSVAGKEGGVARASEHAAGAPH